MSDLTKATLYKDLPKHRDNPFMEKLPALMLEKVGDKISRVVTQDVDIMKKTTDSLYAKDGKGMIAAETKIVDKATFVKVYTDTIQTMTGVSQKAIKVFYHYIVPRIKKQETFVHFDLDECLNETELSKPTVYTALAELIDHELIARSPHTWMFHINPAAIFNGDRIRVVNEYLREGSDSAKARRKLDEMYNEPDEMTEEEEPKDLRDLQTGDDSDW